MINPIFEKGFQVIKVREVEIVKEVKRSDGCSYLYIYIYIYDGKIGKTGCLTLKISIYPPFNDYIACTRGMGGLRNVQILLDDTH